MRIESWFVTALVAAALALSSCSSEPSDLAPSSTATGAGAGASSAGGSEGGAGASSEGGAGGGAEGGAGGGQGGTSPGWSFDWAKRADRNGNPAGVFDKTPFPIDDKSTSYAITTDDGAKTYQLGTLYFVDGASGDDGHDGLSPGKAKKTIGAGIAAAGDGNKTIVVRGAHDGFDGVYLEHSLKPGVGKSDTERWTLVGYGQERPVVDAGGTDNYVIQGTKQPDAFVTIQRMKLQDSKTTCVRLGQLDKKLDGHFSLIDLALYDCKNDAKTPGDGNVYYLNVDRGWIYHCNSEHTKGHCLKIGDGSSHMAIEWTLVDGCGWYENWDGPAEYWGAHPSGIDLPADVDNAFDITVRYNICKTSLFYCVQIRRVKGFDFHHNEVYDSPHFDDVAESVGHSLGHHQVLVYGGHTSGRFHSNVIRDPGTSSANNVRISSIDADNPQVLLYNNLVYGGPNSAISVASGIKADVRILNNSLHTNSQKGGVIDAMAAGGQLVIQNNILVQAGAGPALAWFTDEPTHSFNRYYFPGGTRGVELGEGESDGDPSWAAQPEGAYQPDFCRLQEALPGTDLSKYFTVDFDAVERSGWDMGAREHKP
ncbi:MAG: hypothetical protein HY744_25970 [Deltaproteobacteria bacterium]|nr:hypothetical protein [Deltaproteobacteria bacterium]